MFYVYVIESLLIPGKRYVGYSKDVEKRLKAHNLGDSIYTSQYKPWKLILSFGFESREKAQAFEQYLKTSSGKTFALKRLL